MIKKHPTAATSSFVPTRRIIPTATTTVPLLHIVVVVIGLLCSSSNGSIFPNANANTIIRDKLVYMHNEPITFEWNYTSHYYVDNTTVFRNATTTTNKNYDAIILTRSNVTVPIQFSDILMYVYVTSRTKVPTVLWNNDFMMNMLLMNTTTAVGTMTFDGNKPDESFYQSWPLSIGSFQALLYNGYVKNDDATASHRLYAVTEPFEIVMPPTTPGSSVQQEPPVLSPFFSSILETDSVVPTIQPSTITSDVPTTNPTSTMDQVIAVTNAPVTTTTTTAAMTPTADTTNIPTVPLVVSSIITNDETSLSSSPFENTTQQEEAVSTIDNSNNHHNRQPSSAVCSSSTWFSRWWELSSAFTISTGVVLWVFYDPM